jgi:hypothetical protein
MRNKIVAGQENAENNRSSYSYRVHTHNIATSISGKPIRSWDFEGVLTQINGYPVLMIVKKDGRELTTDEKTKEMQRLDETIEEANSKTYSYKKQRKYGIEWVKLLSYLSPISVEQGTENKRDIDIFTFDDASVAPNQPCRIQGKVWVDRGFGQIIRDDLLFSSKCPVGSSLLPIIPAGSRNRDDDQLITLDGTDLYVSKEMYFSYPMKYLLKKVVFTTDSQFCDYRKFMVTSISRKGQ